MLTKKNEPVIIFSILSGFFIILIFLAIGQPAGDFANYYFGAQLFAEGKFTIAQVYEVFAFNLAVFNKGSINCFVAYTSFPPLTVFLHLPFVFLEMGTAKIIWNVINTMLFLFTLHRSFNHFQLNKKLLLLVPILFFIPLRNGIYFGQAHMLLFFLLVEGWIAYTRNKSWVAAICWGLAIVFKVFPVFILLFLLLQKSYQLFFRCLLVIITSVAISLLFIDVDVWITYLSTYLPRILNAEINNTYVYNYQSMQVFLKNLLVPDQMHNAHAPFDSPQAFTWIYASYRALLLSLCIAVSMNRNIAASLKFSCWIFCMILISGYGTTYSMILFLFPALAIYTSELKYKAILIALIFLVCNIPIHWFGNSPFLLQYLRLYALLLLMVFYLVSLKPAIHKNTFAVFALLLIAFGFNGKMELENNYYLKKEEALLIYDFRFVKDSVQIDYFTNAGPQQKLLASNDPVLTNEAYPLSQLTTNNNHPINNKEHILKAVLINDSKIVYLSDKNRGVGFYTLRFKQK